MKKFVLSSVILVFLLLSISVAFAYSLGPFDLDVTSPLQRLAIWILNLIGIKTETGCLPESCNNLYTMVLEKYGSKCSNPNYDPVADVNKDGKIDLYDSAAVSSHCGNGVWCQERLSDTYDPCPYTTTTSTTSTTTTTIPCPPQVCQSLLDRVRRNYGKKCGNIDYDPVADINKDKKVDLFDATSVLNKCGSDGEWCEARVNDTSNPCASVQQLINNCMDKCSKRYPAFWCRFTCSVSCNIGFC